jgi:hypothetical protein
MFTPEELQRKSKQKLAKKGHAPSLDVLSTVFHLFLCLMITIAANKGVVKAVIVILRT